MGRRSVVEALHRRVRRLAPVVSRRLQRVPAVSDRVKRVYMRAEGSVVKQRFESHDYGMVGVIKQVIDSCGLGAVDHDGSNGASKIRSIHIAPAQVFIHKAQA